MKPFFYILGALALIAAVIALVAPSLSQDEWLEQAKLVSDNEAGKYEFGQAIDIDGDTAVVGVPFHGKETDPKDAGVIVGKISRGRGEPGKITGLTDEGAVYVYQRTGDSWSLQAKLFLPETKAGIYRKFGKKVAIDGDNILATAEQAVAGNQNLPLFVFSRSANTWSLQAQLTLPNPSKFQFFINFVALKGDTAVAAAGGEPLVFHRDKATGTWSYEAQLKRPKPSDIYCKDPRFGGSYLSKSVAIDGDTIIVSGGGRVNCPYAYVFVRDTATTGSWLLQAELTPHPRELVYNTAVALSGNTAVVGSPGDDGERGAAYVYERNTATGNWSKQAKLVPNDVPLLLTYGFGTSVAVDGNTIVVGSSRYAIQAILLPSWTQKAAYVFARRPGTSSWSLPVKLIPRDYNKYLAQFYGQRVDVSGERVIVNVGSSFNAVYIFQQVDSQNSAN